MRGRELPKSQAKHRITTSLKVNITNTFHLIVLISQPPKNLSPIVGCFAAVFMVALDPNGTPDVSVGKYVPGIDVKLSDGREGEVPIRPNQMFSKQNRLNLFPCQR